MSTSSFDNPLERLALNPTGMNWRNLWDATTQYYLNDVVVSPANSASYILNGQTTIIGGLDPTLNPDWIELSLQTTGVTTVNAGIGISVANPSTNPTVNNTGVLTITAGNGISNTGTAQDVILNNTGLVSLIGGPGIQYSTGFPYPTITNTGIRTITAGSGITRTPGSDPQIANSGILAIQQGAGIAVTPNSQNPQIDNTGVLSLTVNNSGSGLQNIGTSQNPNVINTGVLSITAGPGITSTGGQNPTLSASSSGPTLSYFGIPSSFSGGPLVSISTSVLFNIGSVTSQSSRLALDLLNGAPDTNGTWLLDISGFGFINVGGPTPLLPTSQSRFEVLFLDRTTVGGPFPYNVTTASPTQGGMYMVPGVPPLPLTSAQPLSFGQVILKISDIRLSGLRVFDDLAFLNNTAYNYYLTSYPIRCFATYYPDGLQ
jgi:hypothetical protein